MRNSAELVVRGFLATFPRSDVDEMMAFFAEDAIYADGARATHRGVEAIREALQATIKVMPSTTTELKNLVAGDAVVMTERVDYFEIAGTQFDSEVVGVFEVNEAGRISRWSSYYDMRSLEERVTAGLAAQDQKS